MNRPEHAEGVPGHRSSDALTPPLVAVGLVPGALQLEEVLLRAHRGDMVEELASFLATRDRDDDRAEDRLAAIDLQGRHAEGATPVRRLVLGQVLFLGRVVGQRLVQQARREASLLDAELDLILAEILLLLVLRRPEFVVQLVDSILAELPARQHHGAEGVAALQVARAGGRIRIVRLVHLFEAEELPMDVDIADLLDLTHPDRRPPRPRAGRVQVEIDNRLLCHHTLRELWIPRVQRRARVYCAGQYSISAPSARAACNGQYGSRKSSRASNTASARPFATISSASSGTVIRPTAPETTFASRRTRSANWT